MNEKQQQLVALFTETMRDQDLFTPSVKGVSLFRVKHSFSRTPYSYDSEIIILAQGEKQVYLGSDTYAYDFSHYLVLPVPLPAECEGRVEQGRPILGLTITIDPIEVGEILLDMGDDPQEIPSLPKGIYSAPMNEMVYDATVRLLRAINDRQDRQVLAPMIKKELIYRVMRGEKGEILRAFANRNRRFFQIAKLLQKIHASYAEDFDIERIARELEMSSSTFHSSFKKITDTSPLQYIKNVRLHKARSLMVQEGFNTNAAAMQVGYESPSQFIREYKRLFGVTPAKDVTAPREPLLMNP